MDNTQQEQTPAEVTNGEPTTTTDETPADSPQGKALTDQGDSEQTADVNGTDDAAENDVSATEAGQATEATPTESPPEDDEKKQSPVAEPEANSPATQPDVVKDTEDAKGTGASPEEAVKQQEQVEAAATHGDKDEDKPAAVPAEAAAVASPEEVAITEPVKGGVANAEGAQAAAAASSTPTPNVNFTGKWKSVRHENLDEYMKAAGVNFLMRKLAARASPTTDIKQEGNHFQVKLSTGFFNQEAEFNIGEEYQTSSPFSDKLKCVSTWDGEKLMTASKPEDESKKGLFQNTTREIIDGELVVTLKVGEVAAKRFFKKVE